MLCCATMELETGGPLPGQLQSWMEPGMISTLNPVVTTVVYNTPEHNLGVVGSYEQIYRTEFKEISQPSILVFAHDDVIMREHGWDARLLREFRDPSVGVVGFGGALVHGSPNLYKRPYYLPGLGRSGYLSNVDDAEVHGERFTGAADVAVLDGFVLAVRRSFLDKIGGFQQLIDAGIDFIGYDYMICGLAHRLGYRVRVVGCRCHHKGGGTSTKVNVDRQEEYDRAHRIIYEQMRDVLPWECA